MFRNGIELVENVLYAYYLRNARREYVERAMESADDVITD